MSELNKKSFVSTNEFRDAGGDAFGSATRLQELNPSNTGCRGVTIYICGCGSYLANSGTRK